MKRFVPLQWIFSTVLFLLIIALLLDSRTESQIVPVWCSTPIIISSGIHLILSGFFKKKRRELIVKAGIRTTGTVVNHRGSKYYTYLSIQYNLAGGQRIEVESRQNVIFDFDLTGMGMMEKREVDIVYNFMVPSEIYFPESFTFRWYPIIEMIFGIIIVIVSVLISLI